jgi:hypothetical protein
LWTDQDPLRLARLRQGEILAASNTGTDGPRAVPHGLIHDWVGAVFIPSVTLDQVFAVVHDYDRYSQFYRPAVAAAAVFNKGGEDECFRVRYIRKVLFVSEVLDAEFKVQHVEVDADRRYSIARSTRLEETRTRSDSDKNENATADENGYIWRIYTISKYEQRDGGVYIEQENVVLSRAIPASLRWLVEPAVRRLSRELLMGSLRQTRAAVCAIVQEHSLTGDSSQGRRDRQHFGTDQGLDLVPNARIGFNLNMRLHENLSVPGKAVTIDLPGSVVETEISQNLGSPAIRRDNLPPSVEKSIQLIEIDSLRNVRGNQSVILS